MLRIWWTLPGLNIFSSLQFTWKPFSDILKLFQPALNNLYDQSNMINAYIDISILRPLDRIEIDWPFNRWSNLFHGSWFPPFKYAKQSFTQLAAVDTFGKTFTCWFIHLNFCLIDKHKQEGEKTFLFRSLQSTNNKQLIVINNCGNHFSFSVGYFVLRVYINAYQGVFVVEFLRDFTFFCFSLGK